jgi:DNA replication protein DnaC
MTSHLYLRQDMPCRSSSDYRIRSLYPRPRGGSIARKNMTSDHPVLQKIEQLGLSGMATALREQFDVPDIEAIGFEQRLELLLDRELETQENRLLQERLNAARLPQEASLGEVEYRASRGLSKHVMRRLSSCGWVRSHHNVIITGPTGSGKTFIACALTHIACVSGYTGAYHRLSRLLDELEMARRGGYTARLQHAFSCVDVLVLDDWGQKPLTDDEQRDLFELFDARYLRRATIVTSHVPVEQWHELMPDSTLADAVLDRLVYNAHYIRLAGESMRKRHPLSRS